jgi:ferredoxin-nitrite reductase
MQFREVAAKDAIHVVEAVQDLGLTSHGAGADNIRNVTGDATAGIDPGELIDTRPHARAGHFHILNQRTLYGLPRKFNVSFDGGGAIPTLEDTNDIGFQAVEVEDGAGVAPGVWFKLVVGDITGHRDLARETGAIVQPGETAEVADAIVRIYIAEGDRTNRTKARLKYVLDRYAVEAGGLNGFFAKVEQQLGRPIARVDAKLIRPRPAQDRQAHIGAHPQKQPGLFYLGVVLPVGKMSCAQIRSLAAIARDLGDGDIRLTVWQNLLISGISEARLKRAKVAVEKAGLEWRASSIRAGLIACAGSRGCRFSAADTKAHAEEIAAWCEARVKLDQPVNIHVAGCHHSCAQYYICGGAGVRGRQRPLARSNLAARRADEARRWPATAAAHDGRDGAAGLRSMRL